MFLAFLRLGLTSFGGPVAHLGYFRDELVERRKWLADAEYADLVAVSQFLPGPASSQVGFVIGLYRAGPLGAIAAFIAFTLPSAILLTALAFSASVLDGFIGEGITTGLKVAAVAVVAHAVLGMARTLAPDRSRAAIAAAASACVLLAPGLLGQLGAMVIGAVVGAVLRGTPTGPVEEGIRFTVSKRIGWASLVTFVTLLAGLPWAASVTNSGPVELTAAFYRAGALVVGGGHVVLPLLEASTVSSGWVTPEQFVAGYGAAQAVPGPLFTFAAYLGALAEVGPGGVAGAALATIAIFLPGFLLIVGVLPFWNQFRADPRGQAVMRGVNAAVVGVLAAALYDPLFTTGITSPATFGLALTCFVMLVAWRFPAWAIVIVGAGGGVLLAL